MFFEKVRWDSKVSTPPLSLNCANLFKVNPIIGGSYVILGLALIIIAGGVFAFGLYYKYGLAYGLIPAMMGGTIYILWQSYKRRHPSAKELPDMPTFRKIFKNKKL